MKHKNIKTVKRLRSGGGRWMVSGAVLAAMGLGEGDAFAHGFVGDCFFAPTIATDDPFATDELLLPSVSYVRNPGNPAVGTTDIGFEFDKEIFPKFALGISGDWLYLTPQGQPPVSGWDDFALSAKYQIWQNEAHQVIFSAGAIWKIGDSGSHNVGADPANVITPTIYFGKGFGDLPDKLEYGRPLVITGMLGEDLPTLAEPNNLEWGVAVEYNLQYLQSQVKDIGLPAPFKTMIPVVEFTFTSPENRDGGQTTGTINPGVFYENTYFQLGAEAIIPVNSASGHNVGAVVQLQIFIDDLMPKIFGHPIFGKD